MKKLFIFIFVNIVAYSEDIIDNRITNINNDYQIDNLLEKEFRKYRDFSTIERLNYGNTNNLKDFTFHKNNVLQKDFKQNSVLLDNSIEIGIDQGLWELDIEVKMQKNNVDHILIAEKENINLGKKMKINLKGENIISIFDFYIEKENNYYYLTSEIKTWQFNKNNVDYNALEKKISINNKNDIFSVYPFGNNIDNNIFIEINISKII